MDQRNKLKDTYMPERKTQGETVVIGISGGLKSMVAASLLKIQKYNLLAFTIVNSWEDFGDDEKKVISCSMSEEKKEQIKNFCHHLGIPHQFIKTSSEFREEVVERWKSDKLTGSYSQPCLNCHDLRIKILYHKMQELKASHLATGHLAKIYQSETPGVHTSNDEAHDQSYLLARLPSEIINSLLLPLSDLQHKEVVKLAENFGFKGIIKNIEFGKCFPTTEPIINYLTSHVPVNMLKAGEMTNVEGDTQLGEYPSVIGFNLAESTVGRDERSKLVFVKYDAPSKKMIFGPETYFEKKKFVLRNCQISLDTPWSTPFRAYIHMGSQEYAEGWVYPKALDVAYVELDQPVRVIAGANISLIKKKGKNAKVFLSGEVTYVNETIDEEQDAKVDYSRDW